MNVAYRGECQQRGCSCTAFPPTADEELMCDCDHGHKAHLEKAIEIFVVFQHNKIQNEDLLFSPRSHSCSFSNGEMKGGGSKRGVGRGREKKERRGRKEKGKKRSERGGLELLSPVAVPVPDSCGVLPPKSPPITQALLIWSTPEVRRGRWHSSPWQGNSGDLPWSQCLLPPLNHQALVFF